VTTGGCDFDLGGRSLTLANTFDMTGLGRITVTNAQNITLTDAGKLRARGDLVEPDGVIVSGGAISLTASGDVAIAGAIDVTGDPAGAITITATGGITLQNGAHLQGNGKTSFVDDGHRLVDGGDIDLESTGGSITIGATTGGALNVTGSSGGEGGTIYCQAARNVMFGGLIDVSGGASDGGIVIASAGDDITIGKDVSVASRGGGGFGGDIILTAGDDSLGGILPGGSLTIDDSTLDLSGSSLDGFGGDGGNLFAYASGLLQVIGPNAVIRADAGPQYDGQGGTITLDTTDDNGSVIGPLDGDLTVEGTLNAYGGDGAGQGGDVSLFAGRNLTLSADVGLRGDGGGGSVDCEAGGDVVIGGAIDASASTMYGDGGTALLTAGAARDATLTIVDNITMSAGSAAAHAPTLTVSSCALVVNSGVAINAAGPDASAPIVTLIARHPMQLNANSRYIATPAGVVETRHPVSAPPVIGSNVVFNPLRRDIVAANGAYQGCGLHN